MSPTSDRPPRTKFALPSEDGILGTIGRHFPNTHPGLILCRGDDCAMFAAGKGICVSADLFLEDIHFRSSYFSAAEIGHKALAVNVSDLAACGAKPVAFVLCLGLPAWVDSPWLDEFFAGMSSLADRFNMALAGGDLSTAQNLHISITVFGERLEGCDFLRRGGSIPGDKIFIIGSLGLARTGLKILEAEGRRALTEWPEACAAHLRPIPQVEAGLMLARAANNARPPALMDLSDGLLRDLPRLLGQNGELGSRTKRLGADLNLSPGSLHPESIRHAELNQEDPVREALISGEDYSLLGSCAPDMVVALKTAIPGFRLIGEVTDAGNIICNGRNVGAIHGFDHFENSTPR